MTAGSSLTVTVLSWSALVASSTQCALGTWRVFNEWFDPDQNDELDSNWWYRITSDTLDAVAVAGGLACLGQAAQAALRLSRTSGRPLGQILRGMTRPKRKRLAKDLAHYAGEASTRRQFIRLARQGAVRSIFSRQEVNKAVINQLLNSVSSGLTLGGSGAYGVFCQITVHLVEEK
jgi:hypothetical protein